MLVLVIQDNTMTGATDFVQVTISLYSKYKTLLSLFLHLFDVFRVIVSLPHLFICRLSHFFEQYVSLQHRLI